MYLRKIFVISMAMIALPFFAFSSDLLKNQMLSDLDHIKAIFSLKYAPMTWKEKYKEWNLNEEIDIAKAKLNRLPQPTVKEFQRILKTFFDSAADYHVGADFYSSEAAFLHFTIKESQGRYFIVDIDREKLPYHLFPFEKGDEILSFNDVDIATVIQEFKKSEFTGGNTKESEQALAEMYFTNRFAQMGHTVPQGKVTLIGRTKYGTSRKALIAWDYHQEEIGEPGGLPHFNLQLPSSSLSLEKEKMQKIKGFFDKKMVPFFADSMFDCKESPHAIGARKSFIPELGRVLWRSASDCTFDAYIFKSPKGANVGYIRIATYKGDSEEAEEFRKIIERFKSSTDALIIDQVNNLGGSLFYVYAMASMLTDKPLSTPKHHITLTQDEIFTVTSVLHAIKYVSNDHEAQLVLGKDVGGYVVNYKFAKLVAAYCNFMISEWNRGVRMTSPTYLFGVNDIEPHPTTRYTKKILYLINSLDFSGADFFPAILQDNHRALIVGERTAGAGGYVLSNSFYNRSGIKQFVLTGSLAVRKNSEPLENLGVHPDIELKLTPYDLQNQYVDYKNGLLTILDHIVLAK